MLHLGMRIATGIHRFFDYTPAGLIIARTRQCLRWGVPAMGVGLLCFLIAATLTAAIKQGAPGWLNLAAIVLIIDGLRLAVLVPVMAVRCLWARITGTRAV